MENEKLKEKIAKVVPEASFNEGLQFLEVTVPSEHLHKLAQQLKTDEETKFDYLINLTGVDWPENLSVVYHLTSTVHRHTIVLKTFTNGRENPAVDTVCDIWRTAEWHEREAFDLLGIRFNNHPDMRRLFLDDDWEGYPLRKDYEDNINMISL